MRRIVLALLVLFGASAAVDVIGDHTQTRPETVVPGSRSEIVLRVDTQRYKQGLVAAAHNLWATCSGTTTRRLVAEPGIERIGEHTFRFSVEPALGRYTYPKLVGCLEDAVLERVRADVESVRFRDG